MTLQDRLTALHERMFMDEMPGMTVTFFGHAEIVQADDVRRWLTRTMEPLILDFDILLSTKHATIEELSSARE